MLNAKGCLQLVDNAGCDELGGANNQSSQQRLNRLNIPQENWPMSLPKYILAHRFWPLY